MQRMLLIVTALALSSPAAAVTLRGVTQPQVTNGSTLDFATSKLQSGSWETEADPCQDYVAPKETFKEGQPSAACQQKHCMPQCRYQCTDPQCDQECTPECLAPECQTRCPSLKGTSMFMAGCKITCVKPACEVVCPERHCAASGCADCKTVCQRPKCTVACPDAGCQEVCKEPKCKFNCGAAKEKCPEPECKMNCEQSSCLNVEDGMPPLAQGMVIVDAVSPESLNLGKGFAGQRLRLVGKELECSESHTERLTLASVDAASMTVEHCADMVRKDSRCGAYMEVGRGYCMCQTGHCTSTFHDAGEDLYEIFGKGAVALLQAGAQMVSMEVKTVVDGKFVSSTVNLPMQ